MRRWGLAGRLGSGVGRGGVEPHPTSAGEARVGRASAGVAAFVLAPRCERRSGDIVGWGSTPPFGDQSGRRFWFGRGMWWGGTPPYGLPGETRVGRASKGLAIFILAQGCRWRSGDFVGWGSTPPKDGWRWCAGMVGWSGGVEPHPTLAGRGGFGSGTSGMTGITRSMSGIVGSTP